MTHTPIGYRIENGMAVIDEPAAEKVRRLYENYLTGMSLDVVGKSVGFDFFHSAIKRILSNRHYLGDDFYPAIIDEDIFNDVQNEITRRAEKLGRIGKVKEKKSVEIPTMFTIEMPDRQLPDPIANAEYLYSLIESEVL